MLRTILCCVSLLALVMTQAPARAADDCEAAIAKLEESKAEGEQRLAEKNAAIALCGRQYRREATIQALVKECAKYAEQPVVKRQFLAECQLAAFGYANALRTLKSEYRK